MEHSFDKSVANLSMLRFVVDLLMLRGFVDLSMLRGFVDLSMMRFVVDLSMFYDPPMTTKMTKTKTMIYDLQMMMKSMIHNLPMLLFLYLMEKYNRTMILYLMKKYNRMMILLSPNLMSHVVQY